MTVPTPSPAATANTRTGSSASSSETCEEGASSPNSASRGRKVSACSVRPKGSTARRPSSASRLRVAAGSAAKDSRTLYSWTEVCTKGSSDIIGTWSTTLWRRPRHGKDGSHWDRGQTRERLDEGRDHRRHRHRPTGGRGRCSGRRGDAERALGRRGPHGRGEPRPLRQPGPRAA